MIDPLRLLGYFLWIFKEIVSGTLSMTTALFTPRGYSRPMIVQVPLRCTTDLEITMFASSITITPGTLVVAIAAGDEVTGASTFILEEGLDTGPVLGTMTESIRPRDTAGELLGRLAEAGSGLLLATLDGLEAGRLRAEPQATDGVSYAGKLTAEDARVRWTDPAIAVDRHIRSVTPAPGAWTTLAGDRVKIGAARPAEPEEIEALGVDPGLAPGHIRWDKRAVLVGTASSPLVVERLQPPGKKMMNALDWIRGARIESGAEFV